MWCPQGQCHHPGFSSSFEMGRSWGRSLPGGRRTTQLCQRQSLCQGYKQMRQVTCGLGCHGLWKPAVPHKAREPALCLESLVADSLGKGALTWFPWRSPHEQRHKQGCVVNNVAVVGAWQGGSDKLGWAVQDLFPEAPNAKPYALDRVVNYGRKLKSLWWGAVCPWVSMFWMNPYLKEMSWDPLHPALSCMTSHGILATHLNDPVK